MAGYSTRNQVTQQTTFAVNDEIRFKTSELDRQAFRAQIDCDTANASTANLETSFDGGTTWSAAPLDTAVLADSTTSFVEFFSAVDMLGPLTRIRFSGGGPVIDAVWITRIT